jgi:4-amino-4-deoxy-L-arabinose transferase-like glycosyltransferase
VNRSDKIALVLSLLAIPVSYWIGGRVYEHMAHLEDEMAYVWQAQVMAHGQLTVPSPAYPNSFLYPFVVDYNGLRFGKYPLGWPALLSIGERLGARNLVNPLLAGLCIWLIYRLGKRILGETVGVLAAGLTLVSPFFLVNTASLLSHPLGLVLSATFTLFWLEAFGNPVVKRPWLPTIVGALALGGLILTRPFTALGVAIPFIIHGIYLLTTGDWATRRRLLAFAGLVALIGTLYFVWQYAVTGDPFLNPYVLWWPYDKIGFGPGHGHKPIGHTLEQARINTKFSLSVGYWDLFGWPKISWIFIPFGILAILRKPAKRLEAILVSSVIVCLVIFYMAYWVGASLYGPRYYFEGFYSLAILSAAGVAWLAGWPIRPGDPWPKAGRWQRARSLLVSGLVAGLVAFNLVFYLPNRLEKMHGLYGVQRAALEPFLTQEAQNLTPALIIVHPQKEWIEYGRLLELESPFLDSPFIFIYSRGSVQDQAQAAQFPERKVYHYYADEPGRFYLIPRGTH